MKRAESSPPPPLFGLILAGGRSTRMGRDKAALQYGGRTEPMRLKDLLRRVCEQVFVSVPANAPATPDAIPDIVAGIGPMGGILSAMGHAPAVAWLVVACDMPFLDAATLRLLVAGRKPDQLATCLTRDDALEPLCAIYEPAIAANLRASVAKKEYSPRQLLAGLSVQLIEVQDPDTLQNINAPEEYKQARRRLEKE